MNYLVESARLIGQILGVVVGDGYVAPVEQTVKEYPHLPYYF